MTELSEESLIAMCVALRAEGAQVCLRPTHLCISPVGFRGILRLTGRLKGKHSRASSARKRKKMLTRFWHPFPLRD